MADARDLKSLGEQSPCRFESGPGHNQEGFLSARVSGECFGRVLSR
jgi:hypothetical protein